MLVGVAITMVVQSSSISTSLVVPMVAMEILSLRQVFPYTWEPTWARPSPANLAALSTGNVAAGYGVAGAPAVQRLRNCPGVAGFASSRPADLPGGEDGRRDDAQPSGPLIYMAVVFLGLPFLVILAFR